MADDLSATTTVTMDSDKTVTAVFDTPPGLNSQWVYTVTYGTTPEVTTWTVTVTDDSDAVGSVDCYKTGAAFSAPPQRATPQASFTLNSSDTWRSKENLAQYKTVVVVTGSFGTVTTTSTDTYTGTPDMFTVGATWSFVEHAAPSMGPASDTTYTVVVVGPETVLGHDCYKVTYSVAGSVKKTEWWSPEVMGFVKQINTGSWSQTETFELVSYNLV